jgi:hypothetical protein
MGCQLMGGTEAVQATTDGRGGSCHVCGKSIQLSPYVDRGFAVSFEGALLFVPTAGHASVALGRGADEHRGAHPATKDRAGRRRSAIGYR